MSETLSTLGIEIFFDGIIGLAAGTETDELATIDDVGILTLIGGSIDFSMALLFVNAVVLPIFV